jgi:hypothetical protein
MEFVEQVVLDLPSDTVFSSKEILGQVNRLSETKLDLRQVENALHSLMYHRKVSWLERGGKNGTYRFTGVNEMKPDKGSDVEFDEFEGLDEFDVTFDEGFGDTDSSSPERNTFEEVGITRDGITFLQDKEGRVWAGRLEHVVL